MRETWVSNRPLIRSNLRQNPEQIKPMDITSKQHIALISVHGDPAVEIGKEEAGGQNVYVRQVGEALAQPRMAC
jgi:hypothetical protein